MPASMSRSERDFLAAARTATLATLDEAGRPRLVPVCFVLADDAGPGGRARLYTPIDEKPKRSADPHRLARVGDIARRPGVDLLVERWSEDWTQLAWLRCRGTATLLEPGSGSEPDDERTRAIAALRRKYPQYAGHALERRPLIRVTITEHRSWGVVTAAAREGAAGGEPRRS